MARTPMDWSLLATSWTLLFDDQEKRDECLERVERVLGEDHPGPIRSRTWLAWARLSLLGDEEAACRDLAIASDLAATFRDCLWIAAVEWRLDPGAEGVDRALGRAEQLAATPAEWRALARPWASRTGDREAAGRWRWRARDRQSAR